MESNNGHVPVKAVDLVCKEIGKIKRPCVRITFDSIAEATRFMSQLTEYTLGINVSPLDSYERHKNVLSRGSIVDGVKTWLNNFYHSKPWLSMEAVPGVFVIEPGGVDWKMYLDLRMLFPHHVQGVADYTTVCFLWAAAPEFSEGLFSERFILAMPPVKNDSETLALRMDFLKERPSREYDNQWISQPLMKSIADPSKTVTEFMHEWKKYLQEDTPVGKNIQPKTREVMTTTPLFDYMQENGYRDIGLCGQAIQLHGVVPASEKILQLDYIDPDGKVHKYEIKLSDLKEKEASSSEVSSMNITAAFGYKGE